MRKSLDKIMDRLGVDRVLYAYETQPWAFYDEEKGVTCSAEVRMGPDADELECEIQFILDDDREPIEEDDEDEEGEGESESDTTLYELQPGIPYQIMIMRILPVNANQWDTDVLIVKEEDYENKIAEWDLKGADFFRACVESIQMEELPNIDELIENTLSDDSFWGSRRRGKVGRKSPRIKPAELLGFKKPGGMGM